MTKDVRGGKRLGIGPSIVMRGRNGNRCLNTESSTNHNPDDCFFALNPPPRFVLRY